MDGNRRWAKRRSLSGIFGHKQGVETVREIVQAADRLGIEVLTLYAFSSENWERSKIEIRSLFSLLTRFIEKESRELMDAGVCFRVLGDLSKFPENIKNEVSRLCVVSSKNTGLALNIALNYGARQEIIRAFEEMYKRGITSPTEDVVSSFLYTAGQPDPDLLIRTSGEIRVSNFLLWQIAYAEIYVTDKMWPDFTQSDLEDAVVEFQKRKRRFGK